METNAKYQQLVAATKVAVESSGATQGKWVTVGKAASSYFESEAALVAVKVQFCADAIVPAMKAEHREALLADIPRKGTEEYNAAAAKWDALKATRKAATATRDTYFANVVKYAWPKEKVAPSPKAIEVFVREHLEAIRNKLEKAEAAEFDIVKMQKHIEAALATL